MSSVLDGRDLTGVRWSGLVVSRCARRVFYEHHGQEKDEPDERTRQMWARGRRYEQIVVDEVLAELAANGIVGERQIALPWPGLEGEQPIGKTHVDLIAPVGGAYRVVEVKSNAGATLQQSAAIQVAGQAYIVSETYPQLSDEDDVEVDAFVEAVDSHTGERRSHPIRWEHYQVTIEELWMLARLAVDATSVPDRVAEYPGAGECLFCPFKGTCWADWTPTPIDTVLGMDDVGAELAEIDAELKLNSEREKALKERQIAARDQLRAHLPLGELVRVGPARVKLTLGNGRRTFRLAEAETARPDFADEFEAYINVGDPIERWTVK